MIFFLTTDEERNGGDGDGDGDGDDDAGDGVFIVLTTASPAPAPAPAPASSVSVAVDASGEEEDVEEDVEAATTPLAPVSAASESLDCLSSGFCSRGLMMVVLCLCFVFCGLWLVPGIACCLFQYNVPWYHPSFCGVVVRSVAGQGRAGQDEQRTCRKRPRCLPFVDVWIKTSSTSVSNDEHTC